MAVMNYIWAFLILIALVVSVFTGNLGQTATAAMDSAKSAVETALSILGVMCMWMGMMRIAEKAGFIDKLSKLMSPLMNFLFRDVKSKKAKDAIMMNVAANLFGIGNAATPLGLKAMEELEKENPKKGTATNAMCMFVVINTASIQLIPSTLLAFRSNYGSADPFEIIPAVWLSSLLAVTCGIIAVRWMEKRSKF